MAEAMPSDGEHVLGFVHRPAHPDTPGEYVLVRFRLQRQVWPTDDGYPYPEEGDLSVGLIADDPITWRDTSVMLDDPNFAWSGGDNDGCYAASTAFMNVGGYGNDGIALTHWMPLPAFPVR